MTTESTGQDPEISQRPFVRLPHLERETTDHQGQIDNYNEECTQNDDPYSFGRESYNFSIKNISSTNTGRNKRKNFNPRYTSTSPMGNKHGEENDETPGEMNATTSQDNFESRRSPIYPASPSGSRTVVADSVTEVRGPDIQPTELPAWMQMFNHYEQLVKAAGLAQYPASIGSSSFSECNNDREGNAMQAAVVSDMPEWVRKFGSNEAAVSAIRNLLKAYQERSRRPTLQDVNVTETEPPTPPTTPHNCTSSRSITSSSKGDHPAYRSLFKSSSSIKEEIVNPSPPPLDSSDVQYPKPSSFSDKRETSMSDSAPHTSYEWSNDLPLAAAGGEENWKKKQSSAYEDEDYNNKTTKTESEQQQHYNSHYPDDNDDSSDCCEQQMNRGSPSLQHLRQWCEDSQKNPESFHKKKIKSECDDTDTTTVGEPDNNPYDEDDYSPSPNDFPESPNDDDDEDDDDNYSMNMFCDDEHSTPTPTPTPYDQIRANFRSEGEKNADESPSVTEDKEGSCSNSSSKISVRNLGELFEQNQLNLVPLKLRGGIDEKYLHSDVVQNMSKFTSYIDCQNEMCRLESLREHYHCYDFPCFGKVLSKKEEVIRHVKWHRKRMESLNHGFMRFSSSDDCSTTFGSNCQHNHKQTHYHCFQPNCDRVYISTSDVQMHSNFHRKDSAIHKEGFQRFRANELCSADYCMFAGQKTTHFHCRRDNCRFTFKNKADMEKHKTYHIKDLKLARDGFKKFLKNEPCPYTHCRFSKVCNHIHCARENCFYVLHSSGQLLSHKRKHERIDNEQTYCRYKMLAVKAALLGNAAAATALSPDISPYKFTNSLMQLKEMEINAFIPRASSEPTLPSSNPEPYSKDCVTESSPLSSSISMELLQQIKKRHEDLLQQQNHHPTVNSAPDAEPITSSPQHRYNMALEPTHLTPSIVQQFFTTECPAGKLDSDEPINLKNLPPSDGKSAKVQKPTCPLSERPEPHLHCIVKDCEAVISNNVLDISAHIRLHGYNRDVYATTAATAAAAVSVAPEQLQSSSVGTSNNPMQITTIDGFFNRKRGRPPKNRFVEVYKNAQQSPQAIFTSFKLEKQTTSKDCSAGSDPLFSKPPPSLGIDTQHKADENSSTNLSSPQAQVHVTRLVQSPIASQFTTHRANEHCGVAGGRCSLAMQHHYHCACSPDCTFVTVERDLLSVHLERQHTTPSFADNISKKFKRFDRKIGLDCGINECRLRKTRPHLHCRQCYRQISPFDLETHMCPDSEQRSVPSSPTKKFPELYNSEYCKNDQLQPEIAGDNFMIYSKKNLLRDYTRLPSVTFSTLTELRRKVSEMEPETSTTTKRTHEDEKVLVVRAAGTYFPENTCELSSSSLQAHQKPTTLLPISESIPMQVPFSTSVYCSTPYCKMKRKPHEHCEFCDQSFVDLAKSKAHRLKHLAATIKNSSSHFPEDIEENRKKSPVKVPTSQESHAVHIPLTFDEQPQDLSLSPNAVQDEKMKSSRELHAPASAQPTGHFPNIFPPDFMCGISMQNFHLAQLATLYQQNPYYYQHLYPFLSNAAAITRHQQHRQAPSSYRGEDKPFLPTAECIKPALAGASTLAPAGLSALPASGHFPFLNPLLLGRAAEPPSTAKPITTGPVGSSSAPMPSTSGGSKTVKRKLTNGGGGDDFSAFIDALSPSTKKQMQFAAGLAAAAAAAVATGGSTTATGRPGTHEQHGQHFKIKDEQIPTGYLKFRFNEDCYFPKCGYRNHQSHFHCDRNDCHYSFCDKTRFVQHTARHERLDKLMGNDFRQYRANMNCGYENCPYFKNLGSANKSSHFHCLKCDFICSDTNKVVAHRRQHSKMEYIRMAGFRKVTNSEKCNSTFEATVSTNGNEAPGTVECSYSQKQTHYHCLVCDVSVLSRAQLASHKHKT